MSFLRLSTKNIILALMSLLFSALILAGCVYFYLMLRLPDVAVLKDMRLQVPLRIYTSDGELIGEYGAMRRNSIALNEVPDLLVKAIVATEDQRFFEHSGVDFIGIVRATRELLITGQRSQGASTITMQVARNYFLTPEKTFSRKINEILLALKINSTFSKQAILELYLNRIYLGQHAYGVAAAAEIYFGKKLPELSLSELALIAGLPQAPSKENPISNPQAAKIRRNHVLERMLDRGYIDNKAYQTAIAAPIDVYYHGPKITVDAPHVAEMVRNVIYQQFGDEGYTKGLQVYTTIDSKLQKQANRALHDGLMAFEQRHGGYRKPEKNLGRPHKSLEDWQNAVASMSSEEDILPAAVVEIHDRTVDALRSNGEVVTIPWAGMAWTGRSNPRQLVKIGDVIRIKPMGNTWQLTQLTKVQGALVALNPDNGAVIALNGGFNAEDSGYNRAIQAYRQPGSSFKPFIYAAALAQGYNLATVINDAPIAINDTGDSNKLWRPQNDDNQFHGPTRLRMGLVKSINVMTVRLLQNIGVPYAIDYLSRFGFVRAKLPHSLSLALGTADVTPMQMAAAYTVFANGGYLVTPYFIQQIRSDDGKIIYQSNAPQVPAEAVAQSSTAFSPVNPNTPVVPANTNGAPPRVIDADIAYLITNVLQDVIQHGTGTAATVLEREDIAGKTGTTNRLLDAWFSGYNRRIVTTVWVGYDLPRSLYEHGSKAALPIWIDFMRAALANTPQETLNPPNDIVTVKIDPYSGHIANPDQEDAIFEVFQANHGPTEDSGTQDEGMYQGDGNYNYDPSNDNSEAQLF